MIAQDGGRDGSKPMLDGEELINVSCLSVALASPIIPSWLNAAAAEHPCGSTLTPACLCVTIAAVSREPVAGRESLELLIETSSLCPICSTPLSASRLEAIRCFVAPAVSAVVST